MSAAVEKSGESMAELSQVAGDRQKQNNGEVVWVVEVEKAFGSGKRNWFPSLWEQSDNVCILRVPKSIMTVKREAYVPSFVSLGPYRHNVNSPLSTMDQHKLVAVQHVLERIPKGEMSWTKKFEYLIENIQKLDDEIRQCYKEKIAWDPKTLATVMATDACFILQYFKFCYKITERSDIMNDIMKLENQIPLSVLKAILKLEFESDDKVVDELCSLLECNITKHPFSSGTFSVSSLKKYIREWNPCHLLDLKRKVLVDLLTANNESNNVSQRGYGQQSSLKIINHFNRFLQGFVDKICDKNARNDFIPSAKLLHKAGIKFQYDPNGCESVQFSNPQTSRVNDRATFFLPRINVDDNTEILLRNLMAYEEFRPCSAKEEVERTVISQFVCLLDDLIESEQDIAVLKNDGIIESLLGSDKEVADMFNRLCKGITDYKESNFHFALVSAKKYYNSPSVRLTRGVKEAYCSKPLYWVSILAATAILVMTAVQMAYAIKNG